MRAKLFLAWAVEMLGRRGVQARSVVIFFCAE